MTRDERFKRFLQLANNLYNNKYDYSKAIYLNKYKRIKIICPHHGEFEAVPEKHLYRNVECPQCKKIDTLLKFKENKIKQYIGKVSILYNNYYNYSKVDFNNARDIITIICPKHGDVNLTAISHLNGCGCNKCSKEKMANTHKSKLFKLLDIAKQIHGDKYNYDKVEYINSDIPVSIICPIHGEFKQLMKNHLSGSECHMCHRERSRLIQAMGKDKFIQIANERHNFKYKYDNVVYINNKTPVSITCKEHGDFLARPDNHLQSLVGCPKCRKSIGEKKVMEILNILKINYIYEYTFPNTKFRYDFYLPDLKIVIEYDGPQHFLPLEFFGGHLGLIKQKESDKIKDQLAESNCCHMIRIPYTELHTMEWFFIKKLSKIYKYYVDGIWYYTFFTMAKSLNVPKDAKISEYDKYKTENIKLK